MLRTSAIPVTRFIHRATAVFAFTYGALLASCADPAQSPVLGSGGGTGPSTGPGATPGAQGGAAGKPTGPSGSGGAIGAKGGAPGVSGGGTHAASNVPGSGKGTVVGPITTAPQTGQGGSSTGPIKTTPTTGGATSGGAPGTGGKPPVTTGTAPTVTVSQCGLPTLAKTGVAKPTGAVGNLTVLDWAGYKGAVTYTFDDANSSQIAHYSELNGLGVPMTFFLQTGKSDAGNEIWTQALKDGHELANHSKGHAQTGSASDVAEASKFIQDKFGVKAWTLAAPYGDNSYVAIGKSSFLANRGVNNGVVAPNSSTDPFNLPCFIPAANAAASAFNSQVDSAVSAGGWRIVLVHGFSGGSDSAYQPVAIGEFVSAVKYAKSLGNVWIGTFVNVAAYFRAQKLLSGVTATTSGDSKTYSWTLPANFPPGKCLRVTAGGGNVSQGGKALAWDTHGYYEISLDAGSLTVSP